MTPFPQLSIFLASALFLDYYVPVSVAATSYLTLAAPSRAECAIQRSRFIAIAAPSATLDEFRTLLQQTQLASPRATHYCWAYRLGFPDHPASHHSDAGEPAGAAGPPIAATLAQLQLWNVALIVVRYFGGVKLGIPRLQQAYRHAARLALEAATPVRRQPMCARSFRMSYPAFHSLDHQLKKLGGWWNDSTFHTEVHATAHVPRSLAARFDAAAAAVGALPAHPLHTWQNE